MKKLFRKFPQSILVTLALVFLGIIVAYYAWGISDMIGVVNRAVNTKPSSAGSAGFDIQGAQQLNLRGLVNQ